MRHELAGEGQRIWNDCYAAREFEGGGLVVEREFHKTGCKTLLRLFDFGQVFAVGFRLKLLFDVSRSNALEPEITRIRIDRSPELNLPGFGFRFDADYARFGQIP